MAVSCFLRDAVEDERIVAQAALRVVFVALFGERLLVVGRRTEIENDETTILCDDELAESFDNGMFKLVLDLTVTFLSESVMEVSVDGDLQSRVYSKEQLREVMGGFDSYFDTDQYNYTVKNGVIYIPTQKYPFAVINKGGQSITIKTYVPFDGNVLQRIE